MVLIENRREIMFLSFSFLLSSATSDGSSPTSAMNMAPCTQATVRNYTEQTAQSYKNVGAQGTYYLGTRDIPPLLKKYSTGRRAIDYGCGTGFATRLLQDLGYHVIGVDNSKDMLTQALIEDSLSHFIHIESGKVPVLDSSYDCCICRFVLFSISTKEELGVICREISRCLREGGIFMVITGSEDLYNHEWVSYDTNFPENQNLTSGAPTKIRLKPENISFVDYYWKDRDYREVFDSSGFQLVEKVLPLGRLEECATWLSETERAPFVIYVLRKTKQNLQ